mgnify:CR=1 FL=1
MNVLAPVTVAPIRMRAGNPGDGGAASSPPPATAASGPSTSLRLSAKERFALLEQFATLVDSGIQIAAALQSMRLQTDDERVGAVLGALEHGVTAGMPLSNAMATMPRAFPAILVQMVRAGEAGGDLAGMLQRTVENLELEATLRGKLKSALIYPAVMLVMTLGVVVFLLTFIVPKFERLFRGKELPLPTRILMTLGEWTELYGMWALAGGGVALFAAIVFARTPRGRIAFDRLLLHLPGVAPVYRTSIATRGVRTLGLLLQTGVPMHAALEHTREVSASHAYRELWHRARHNVLNGGALLDVVRGSTLFGPTFTQIVAAGEATASLDRVLLKCAAQYTKDLERRIRDMVALVEPAMVIFMGAVVGFVALSIMLPIFRMSQM